MIMTGPVLGLGCLSADIVTNVACVGSCTSSRSLIPTRMFAGLPNHKPSFIGSFVNCIGPDGYTVGTAIDPGGGITCPCPLQDVPTSIEIVAGSATKNGNLISDGDHDMLGTEQDAPID